MIATTISRRMLCAAATRSTAAPWRSPCTAISAAPPSAIAKNAVVASTPDSRCSTQPHSAPSSIENTTPSAMKPR